MSVDTYTPQRGFTKDAQVGDSVTYRGKPAATVVKVEAFGLNTKITYSTGRWIVVPGRAS